MAGRTETVSHRDSTACRQESAVQELAEFFSYLYNIYSYAKSPIKSNSYIIFSQINIAQCPSKQIHEPRSHDSARSCPMSKSLNSSPEPHSSTLLENVVEIL